MRKIICLTSLFLLVWCVSAFALITTESCDNDRFQIRDEYHYATADVAAAQTRLALPLMPYISGADGGQIYYRVVPRGFAATVYSRIMGISVNGNGTCTSGGATFDVTINGALCGVQAVIQPYTVSSVGSYGISTSTYSIMSQDRADDRCPVGFRVNTAVDPAVCADTGDYKYGRATPLVAGDLIGCSVTTSAGFAPILTDYVITIYVLD